MNATLSLDEAGRLVLPNNAPRLLGMMPGDQVRADVSPNRIDICSEPIGPDVIIELFMDKLPDSLGDQQRRSKIRNLTYELAQRTKVTENISGARGSAARWFIRTDPS